MLCSFKFLIISVQGFVGMKLEETALLQICVRLTGDAREDEMRHKLRHGWDHHIYMLAQVGKIKTKGQVSLNS